MAKLVIHLKKESECGDEGSGSSKAYASGLGFRPELRFGFEGLKVQVWGCRDSDFGGLGLAHASYASHCKYPHGNRNPWEFRALGA